MKIGENCVDTAVISYVVSDRSGNTATYYHAQLITDTIPPTVNLSPDTVTICYIPNTSYDSTLSVALTTTDWTFTIHDNCTRQLDSSTIRWFIDRSARDVYHPYGYQTIGYWSGIRHYYYYLYATGSCGNTAAATAVIIINPSPILDTIENREQTIDYGQDIQTVVLAYDFTDTVYVSPFSGITRQDYNDDFHSYTQLLHSPYYAGDSTLRVSISNRYNCYPMDTSIIVRVNPHPITITTYGATKKYDGTPLAFPTA